MMLLPPGMFCTITVGLPGMGAGGRRMLRWVEPLCQRRRYQLSPLARGPAVAQRRQLWDARHVRAEGLRGRPLDRRLVERMLQDVGDLLGIGEREMHRQV